MSDARDSRFEYDLHWCAGALTMPDGEGWEPVHMAAYPDTFDDDGETYTRGYAVVMWRRTLAFSAIEAADLDRVGELEETLRLVHHALCEEHDSDSLAGKYDAEVVLREREPWLFDGAGPRSRS